MQWREGQRFLDQTISVRAAHFRQPHMYTYRGYEHLLASISSYTFMTKKMQPEIRATT
jgi:hypothetical protein